MSLEKALRSLRYQVARPFQAHWIPAVLLPPVPLLGQGPTVGQTVLLLPWIILFLAGYDLTFLNPSLDSSGDVASYAMIGAFLTASKANSIFALGLGISYERLVPIHNLYACLSLILSIFHGYVAFWYGDTSSDSADSTSDDRRRLSGDSAFARPGADTNLWKFCWDGNTNMTGSVCTVCMVGLILTSFFRIIRKYLYEPWLLSHIVFSVGVLAFGILHSVPILILPLVWWSLDFLLRYVAQSMGRFPTKATLYKLGQDLVEVRLRRNFYFQAGQFVRLCVPEAAPWQFHPITIVSSPGDKEVVLHIRALGGWSRALVNLARDDEPRDVSVLVQGPYGNLSMDLNNDQMYPIILCISGGIGVTPCQSVAHHLLQKADHGRALKHLRFVWAIRDEKMMEQLPTVVSESGSWYDSEEPANDTTSEKTFRRFQPEVYVTKTNDNEVVKGPVPIAKGRPDIKHLVEEIVAIAQAENVPRVAVITCGPESMVHEVERTCRLATGFCGKVSLDVHAEVFTY